MSKEAETLAEMQQSQWVLLKKPRKALASLDDLQEIFPADEIHQPVTESMKFEGVLNSYQAYGRPTQDDPTGRRHLVAYYCPAEQRIITGSPEITNIGIIVMHQCNNCSDIIYSCTAGEIICF